MRFYPRSFSAATYGGHLELSAFAHLTRRNVKVIQPGLVYVIEWAAGGSDTSAPTAGSTSTEDDSLNDRERRRLRREEKMAEKRMQMEHDEDHSDDPADPAAGAIYVAYASIHLPFPQALTRSAATMTGSTFLQFAISKARIQVCPTSWRRPRTKCPHPASLNPSPRAQNQKPSRRQPQSVPREAS